MYNPYKSRMTMEPNKPRVWKQTLQKAKMKYGGIVDEGEINEIAKRWYAKALLLSYSV